jgi:Fe-S cluster assembly iron-binding protein IscA
MKLLIFMSKEDVMVEISEAASQQIAEYFKDRDIVPIRIFLNEGG